MYTLADFNAYTKIHPNRNDREIKILFRERDAYHSSNVLHYPDVEIWRIGTLHISGSPDFIIPIMSEEDILAVLKAAVDYALFTEVTGINYYEVPMPLPESFGSVLYTNKKNVVTIGHGEGIEQFIAEGRLIKDLSYENTLYGLSKIDELQDSISTRFPCIGALYKNPANTDLWNKVNFLDYGSHPPFTGEKVHYCSYDPTHVLLDVEGKWMWVAKGDLFDDPPAKYADEVELLKNVYLSGGE